MNSGVRTAIKWTLIIAGIVLLSSPTFLSLLMDANKTGEISGSPELHQEPKEVAVESSLSKSVLVVGDKNRFWITLRNRSATPLTGIRLSSLDVPGFKVDSVCWNDGKQDQCSPQDKFSLPGVAAGQTVAIWGNLTATGPTEKHACYAVMSWSGQADPKSPKVMSQMVVPLGGVVVQTVRERQLAAFREFMKDFALPLLLVILGLLVGSWDKAREDTRQAHEQETQQEHATWNSMLPETYKLAIRYYMKIQAGVGGVVIFLPDAAAKQASSPNDAGTREALRRAFFNLLLFERSVRHFLDHNSGFYFKCRAGEELISNAFMLYRKFYVGGAEDLRRNLSLMLQFVNNNELLDDFLQKLDDPANPPTREVSAFRDGWAYFVSWVGTSDCESALLLLRTFNEVLSWELNRPYIYWYGWEESLRYWNKGKVELGRLAKELEKNPETKNIAEEIGSYLLLGEPKEPPKSSRED